MCSPPYRLCGEHGGAAGGAGAFRRFSVTSGRTFQVVQLKLVASAAVGCLVSRKLADWATPLAACVLLLCMACVSRTMAAAEAGGQASDDATTAAPEEEPWGSLGAC